MYNTVARVLFTAPVIITEVDDESDADSVAAVVCGGHPIATALPSVTTESEELRQPRHRFGLGSVVTFDPTEVDRVDIERFVLEKWAVKFMLGTLPHREARSPGANQPAKSPVPRARLHETECIARRNARELAEQMGYFDFGEARWPHSEGITYLPCNCHTHPDANIHIDLLRTRDAEHPDAKAGSAPPGNISKSFHKLHDTLDTSQSDAPSGSFPDACAIGTDTDVLSGVDNDDLRNDGSTAQFNDSDELGAAPASIGDPDVDPEDLSIAEQCGLEYYSTEPDFGFKQSCWSRRKRRRRRKIKQDNMETDTSTQVESYSEELDGFVTQPSETDEAPAEGSNDDHDG